MTQPPTWQLPAPQIRSYSDIARVIRIRIIIILLLEDVKCRWNSALVVEAIPNVRMPRGGSSGHEWLSWRRRRHWTDTDHAVCGSWRRPAGCRSTGPLHDTTVQSSRGNEAARVLVEAAGRGRRGTRQVCGRRHGWRGRSRATTLRLMRRRRRRRRLGSTWTAAAHDTDDDDDDDDCGDEWDGYNDWQITVV